MNKSRPPVTLNISESGELTAEDIYGNPIPLRMSDALRDYLEKIGRHLPEDPQPGTIMPDGTVYAGLSPDTGHAFYAAAKDTPDGMSWDDAMAHARSSIAHGHSDWRLPSRDELNVMFNNRAAIGGFDLSGSFPAGWYWSSSESLINGARSQRFSVGSQHSNYKYLGLSVRCVRG